MEFSAERTIKPLLIAAFFAVLPIVVSGQYSLSHSQAYGGSDAEDGRALAVDAAGNYVTGGPSFSSDLWVPGNKGGSDYWILQFNSLGDTISSRTYGGFNNDDLNAIAYNSSEGLAAFGTTRSNDGDVMNNPAVIGAWLLTLDANGQPLTSRVYAGDLGEQGIDIEALPTGYAVLVESTSPELEGVENNGVIDVWVARTNPVGSPDWALFLGGSDSDIPSAMARTPDGLVIAASSNSIDGDVVGNQGGFDYWVVKVDLDGNVVWAKTYGGSGDDYARDVAIDSDGNIYVIGESDSDDGDKSRHLGRNDVWVIKLDSDGNLDWEKTYGGSDDDYGTSIGILSNDRPVFAAHTNSDDRQLEANKGRSDGWMVFLRANGAIEQQMNYGGSADDYFETLVVDATDRVLVTGTTSSDNGNLALTAPPPRNLWLAEFKDDTVSCTPNDECFVFDVANGIIEVETNEGQVCQISCNVGVSQGPSGAECYGFEGAATWFKVRTDGTARQMTISVSSEEFNTPQVSVMQSTDCQGFVRYDCNIGDDGFVQIVNIDVQPDTAYYIVVGDAQGREGTFTLCASILDVQFCNKDARLYATSTSKGSPLEGPYLPGEEVQFCYEVPVWDKLDCNGIQGIQPTFGPGWDTLNFNLFGMPWVIDTMLVPIADGTWDWYPLGGVRYNFSNPFQGYIGGQGLPPGWYFTNLGDPPPTDGPDDTTGDIVTCLDDSTTWKVCFTLRTYDFCINDMDCSITVKSFADGEIGSQVSQACQWDDPITLEAQLKCCLNPFVTPVPNQTICSGDTVTVLFDSNLDPPVTYVYEVETFGNIVGAESGSGPLLSQQLFNFDSETAAADYTVTAISEGCVSMEERFTVTVRPIPQSSMALAGTDSICIGDEIDLRFTYTGNSPHYSTFAINGEIQPEFVATESPAIATITLDETSQITYLEYRDVFCDGNPTGTFTVHVFEEGVNDTLAALCPGDTIMIADRIITAPGAYSIQLEGEAQGGCDSVVNITVIGLSTSSTFLEQSICPGDTVYVGDSKYYESGFYEDVLVARNGCDSVVTLALTVTNRVEFNDSQLACFGDTVIFRGQIITESGIYRDTVAVTEECDSLYSLSVTFLDNIVLTETVIHPDTGNNSGGVSIMVGGGFPPYTYLWSTGDTSQNLSNVPSGDYSVTVTDAAGCEGQFDFFITTSTDDPIEGLANFRLYPNPVNAGDKLILEFENSLIERKQLTLSIINTSGGEIQSTQHQVFDGANTIQIEVSDMAPGVHMLMIKDPATGSRRALPVVIL